MLKLIYSFTILNYKSTKIFEFKTQSELIKKANEIIKKEIDFMYDMADILGNLEIETMSYETPATFRLQYSTDANPHTSVALTTTEC